MVRKTKSMCPECGILFGRLRNGLVPVHHTRIGASTKRCEGSGQAPRNPLSDGRPLWNGKRNPHFVMETDAANAGKGGA